MNFFPGGKSGINFFPEEEGGSGGSMALGMGERPLSALGMGERPLSRNEAKKQVMDTLVEAGFAEREPQGFMRRPKYKILDNAKARAFLSKSLGKRGADEMLGILNRGADETLATIRDLSASPSEFASSDPSSVNVDFSRPGSSMAERILGGGLSMTNPRQTGGVVLPDVTLEGGTPAQPNQLPIGLNPGMPPDPNAPVSLAEDPTSPRRGPDFMRGEEVPGSIGQQVVPEEEIPESIGQQVADARPDPISDAEVLEAEDAAMGTEPIPESEKKGSLAGRLLRGAGKSGLLADLGVLLGAAVGGEGVRRGVEKGLEVQRQEKRFERGMTFREEQLAQTKALTEARLKIMEEGNKNDAMRIMAQVRASAGKADATAQGKIADRLWDLTKAAAGGEMNREDCIAAIRKETELRGVKWTQEMEAKYDSYFAPYLMRVDDRISPVQSNDMVKAAELQERAARIKVRLRNPELQPLLGAVQGRINEFKSWIFGADPDVVPPEFSKLLTEMGFEVDAVRREATGAAINSSEEKFYNMLVGSLSMDYRALSNQMDIIMDTMQDFRVSPLKRALGAKYSWAGDDYEDALSQLPTFTYQGWLKGTIAAARGGDERSQRLLRDAGIIGGQ